MGKIIFAFILSLFVVPVHAQNTWPSNKRELGLLQKKFVASPVATPEIMELTRNLLSTSDLEAREIAVSRIDYYLSRYSSDQALEIARIELSDPSIKIRSWGVNTFRYLTDRFEARDLMKNILLNENDVVARRGMLYIIRIKPEISFETLDILKIALADSDAEVKENALYALKNKPSDQALLIAKEFEKVEQDARLKQLAGYIHKDIVLLLKSGKSRNSPFIE